MSNGRGRDKKLTRRDVWDILTSTDQPVWTASQIAERTDVSKTTAKNRLQEMSETKRIDSVKVGNAIAYYATEEWKGKGTDISIEERAVMAATDYWEGRLVGGIKDMSVVHSHDGEELSSGNRIQLVVTGSRLRLTKLIGVESGEEFDEIPSSDEFAQEQRTQNEYGGEVATAELGASMFDGPKALLSAELGERFAVPLVEKELGNFETPAPDLDKGNTEWKFKIEDDVPRLLVAGVGARLLRPCENAVYLKNVEVVDIDLSDDEDDEEDDKNDRSLVDDADMDIDVSEEIRSEAAEFEDKFDE